MNRNNILKQMGIQTWVKREKAPNNVSSKEKQALNESQEEIHHLNQSTDGLLSHGVDATKLDWIELQQVVSICTACPLSETRTQTVFGVGNPKADLMLIGEGPGANEDLQGEPFVGRAGKLLDQMLAAINLDRSQVFIANIVKCRPPQNRDPKIEEVATCTPYLRRQIELIQPKLLVALGRIAAQYLLATTLPMTKLRQTIHHYQNIDQNIPLIATFHPAYLLRSPQEKAKAYEDLLRIENLLQQS